VAEQMIDQAFDVGHSSIWRTSIDPKSRCGHSSTMRAAAS
jgi:hypothetical protein